MARGAVVQKREFIKWKKEVYITIVNKHKQPYFKDENNNFYLFKDDCLEFLPLLRDNSIDMIFADPPYFLSNGGITCYAGKVASVNKGKWDVSRGIKETHEFNLKWLKACQNVLTPNGTIWVSGTSHVIFSVGFAMQELGFKILNDIAWDKVNPPPNISCRYFTHATETVIWAAKNKKSKHFFNYPLMKRMNNNKQMKSIWPIMAPRPEEKIFGKHPTQKPMALLERIVLASTKKGDVVLDPFSGSGTTGLAAYKLGRKYIGIELEKEYLDRSVKRFNFQRKTLPELAKV
ncbi:MAG: site-specific DNA-methyltransferase [Deltaproteobacteria bacterium]|nr:site-specific DNA-methyltransferase [Deltaproteobacteria bacterium]